MFNKLDTIVMAYNAEYNTGFGQWLHNVFAHQDVEFDIGHTFNIPEGFDYRGLYDRGMCPYEVAVLSLTTGKQ